MKYARKRLMSLILLAALLTGCAQENPYRVDTVVRIPVNPTEATEAAASETTVPAEIIPETETTKPTEGNTSGGKAPSGGKGGTSGNRKPSGSGNKATEPTVTEPPRTEPPSTEPPVTEVPETDPPETKPSCDPSGYVIGSLEYAILEHLNACRREAGLPELGISGTLSGIAAIRAEEISRSWSHTRPDGRNWDTVLSDFGYGYGAAAENLAFDMGSGDAGVIVAEWMNSGNRDSILNASFTTAGIGIYIDGGVVYIANILIG